MDTNIDFNHLINKMSEMRENNTFFKDMISFNVSNQFDKNEDIDECIENVKPFINTTTERQELNDSDSSFKLFDTQMETNLTPTLEMKANISQKRQLFSFHNKKQLFVNNFCVNNEKTETKVKTKIDNNFNNTLGLSPVKKEFIRDNESKDFVGFDGFQVNSFQSNDKQLETESFVGDYTFKSLSKCSDLELRPEEPKVDINQTFLSPKNGFEDKSISSYFRQNSEPISSMKSFNNSIDNKSIRDSLFRQSFASVSDEINSSISALEMCHKFIDTKNRKRKTNESMASMSDLQSFQREESFTPSHNSTMNSSEETTEKASPQSIGSKSTVTSGLGTISTLGGQTYLMPHSNSIQSIGSLNANVLSPNQILFITPNVLSLTIGCFVDFKLNYLKIRNISVTPFKLDFKIESNVDTLSSLQIDFPKQTINIPPLFDGFLTDKLTITPLKFGSFSVIFKVYASIENINLLLSPISIICNIKTEEIVIKRPLFYSNRFQINYNLFEDNIENQTIDLCITNKQIVNEIPLKLCLESNKCILFEPIYRHPESALHVFRCSDPYTLFLVTKTQYEMRIPIRIQSLNGVQKADTCLTVSTDSQRSHVLAIFRLTATFWSKRELTQQLLQCSETSINLKENQWKEIHFRNKSPKHLIRVNLKCIRNNRSVNCIKLSSNQVMIPPNKRLSIGLFADKNIVYDSTYHLSVTFDSGFGKSLLNLIPIHIISFINDNYI